MKRLVLAIVAGAALYSAFWVWSARDLRTEVNAAIAELRAAGTEVTYDSMALRGYPSRLDLTFERLSVTAPGGLKLETSVAQGLQTVWQRDRWIIVLPAELTVTFDNAQGAAVALTLRPQQMRASLAEALVLEADRLQIDTDDTSFAAGPLLLAARPEGDETYRAFLRATSLQTSALPDAASELLFDGTLTFDTELGTPALLPLPPLSNVDVVRLDYAHIADLAAALRPALPDLAAFLDQRQ